MDIEDTSEEELDKYISNSISKSNPKPTTIEIVKQLDEEEMIAFEPLYLNTGEVDAHGDGITDEELDKFVDNFNKNIENISGNIHHSFDTDGFYPVKAYRLPFTVHLGDINVPSSLKIIERGQPVVEMQFTDKFLWEKRKSGELGGVSIGGEGKRIPNPDYEGDT